ARLARLQGQAQQGRSPFGLGPKLGRRRLRKPDDTGVVAEVVVAQLRMPVEPEPAPDDAVEAADEEVGQEVRLRLVLGAVDLVAVCALEPAVAVESPAAAGVGV